MRKVLFNLALALIAICFLATSAQSAGTREKHSNLGDIYWHGGEDVSYDYTLEELIPIEYYDIDLETSVSNSNSLPLTFMSLKKQ